MSPTLLEVAVALLLVWIGWRIGKLLTPWIVGHLRKPKLYPPDSPWSEKAKDATPRPPKKSKPQT